MVWSLIFAVCRQIRLCLRSGDGFCASPGSFFLSLALAGRAVCNFAFIERPLVIAFFWWFITGEPFPALPLAIFFELFWLDLFPIGGFIPPMAAFPYLLLLSLSTQFGWHTPISLAFPLAASLPLAHVVPVYEAFLRNKQSAWSEKLMQAAATETPLHGLAGYMMWKATLWAIVPGLLLFTGIYLFCLWFVPLVQKQAMFPLSLDWPVLYAIAAIGALLSLRIRRIYLAFALCMCAFVLVKAV